MVDLMAQAEALGVLPRFWDLSGTERVTSRETAEALIRAMGLEVGAPVEAVPGWQVVEPGLYDPGEPWRIKLESGEEIEGAGPVDLPLGIHWWASANSWLLVAPASLPLPDRGWGMTAPLYGLRQAEVGPIGTYDDLKRAGEAVAGAGAGFLGINPVHAGFPTDPDAISPYSPSDRRHFSTDYIDLGQGQPSTELVDVAGARTVLRQVLEARFPDGQRDPEFSVWRAEGGEALRRFATHQALSDRFGAYWPNWPDEYRDPASEAVAAFQAKHEEAVTFHAWAQYLAEAQLGEAASAAPLYLDLAVGTRPDGAETWAEPEVFARGVSLGAPPDAFSPGGQTWGLAPFNPRALIASGFKALAETMRVQFRYAKLLRIDHILGFERAFWVPEDGTPGAYVAMPRDAMLAVVRIEAARAGAAVVGEDLGMIPDGLQDALAASGILGCRVAMFETHTDGARPAHEYAERALTSWGTHDLPTFAGWKAGRDVEVRQSLGHMDQAAADWARGEREAERGALRAVAGDSVEDVHGFLASTPSRLVAVQAEDVLGLTEQPNLPGTIDQYPNWRRRLGVAPERLGGAIKPVAARMADAGRGASQDPPDGV